MRFTAQRENILKPLQILSGVVEKRQTMPILSNVLIKISENEITMTATDTEMEVVAKIDVAVETTGVITVPLRKLQDSCRSLGEGASIAFEVKKDKAEVKSGKTRFSLTTMPAATFPTVESKAVIGRFEIKEKDLKELIEKTQFAMAVQDVRYFLNGMFWEIEKGAIKTVATDGHRLAYARKSVETGVEEKKGVIVPRKAIMELNKVLEDRENVVQVQLGENYIRVNTGDVVFMTKLIDGTYPNYQSVIPTGSDRVMLADRGLLKDCLSRTSVLSSEKYRGIKIDLRDNRLKTVANNPEHEEAEDEVEVNYEADPIEVGFNVSYLIEAVNAIKSEKVKVVFSQMNNSAIIKEQEGDDTIYVVMPMRL